LASSFEAHSQIEGCGRLTESLHAVGGDRRCEAIESAWSWGTIELTALLRFSLRD
jgi:hypothetical protein